jgi:hypothetical protein
MGLVHTRSNHRAATADVGTKGKFSDRAEDRETSVTAVGLRQGEETVIYEQRVLAHALVHEIEGQVWAVRIVLEAQNVGHVANGRELARSARAKSHVTADRQPSAGEVTTQLR